MFGARALKEGSGMGDGNPIMMGPASPKRSLNLSYRQEESHRCFCIGERWNYIVGVSDAGWLHDPLNGRVF